MQHSLLVHFNFYIFNILLNVALKVAFYFVTIFVCIKIPSKYQLVTHDPVFAIAHTGLQSIHPFGITFFP